MLLRDAISHRMRLGTAELEHDLELSTQIGARKGGSDSLPVSGNIVFLCLVTE